MLIENLTVQCLRALHLCLCTTLRRFILIVALKAFCFGACHSHALQLMHHRCLRESVGGVVSYIGTQLLALAYSIVTPLSLYRASGCFSRWLIVRPTANWMLISLIFAWNSPQTIHSVQRVRVVSLWHGCLLLLQRVLSLLDTICFFSHCDCLVLESALNLSKTADFCRLHPLWFVIDCIVAKLCFSQRVRLSGGA